MLQNDVLDVEKLVDTSENGPLQIPQTRKSRLECKETSICEKGGQVMWVYYAVGTVPNLAKMTIVT